MKNLDHQQINRREALKKGLGASVGTAIAGMGGLLTTEKALAWGPVHKQYFTQEQNNLLAKLVPFETFRLDWRNSNSSMVKQCRLYGNASSRGVYNQYIGTVQFDSTYEYLGHEGFQYECKSFGMFDVWCDYYKTYKLNEKDMVSATVECEQGRSDFSYAEHSHLRRLASRPPYTSPSIIMTAWDLIEKTRQYAPKITTYLGSQSLGFFLKRTEFKANSGIETENIVFYEYVYAAYNLVSGPCWVNFSTCDPKLLVKIWGSNNSFMPSVRSLLALTGGGVLTVTAGVASIGNGWTSNLQFYSGMRILPNGTREGPNGTDISFVRQEPFTATKVQNWQATLIATSMTVGTVGAGAGIFYGLYMLEFGFLRMGLDGMLAIIKTEPSFSRDYAMQGVYGHIPYINNP